VSVAWDDLIAALGLMLVLEGILPFLRPAAWRRMLALLAQGDDRLVRMMGLFCMLLGLALIYTVRVGHGA
jgi:uncharacterized protein YjeT (DUF2065 family)